MEAAVSIGSYFTGARIAPARVALHLLPLLTSACCMYCTFISWENAAGETRCLVQTSPPDPVPDVVQVEEGELHHVKSRALLLPVFEFLWEILKRRCYHASDHLYDLCLQFRNTQQVHRAHVTQEWDRRQLLPDLLHRIRGRQVQFLNVQISMKHSENTSRARLQHFPLTQCMTKVRTSQHPHHLISGLRAPMSNLICETLEARAYQSCFVRFFGPYLIVWGVVLRIVESQFFTAYSRQWKK